MIKSRTALIAAALVTALSLTACTSTKAPAQPAPTVEQKTVPVADGAKQMLKALGDLKADIDKGDAAMAKEHAPKIEEAWQTFEDAVKVQDKKLYQDIEEPLHAIIGGTKDGTSLDKPLLTEQAAKLEVLLTPLTK